MADKLLWWQVIAYPQSALWDYSKFASNGGYTRPYHNHHFIISLCWQGPNSPDRKWNYNHLNIGFILIKIKRTANIDGMLLMITYTQINTDAPLRGLGIRWLYPKKTDETTLF